MFILKTKNVRHRLLSLIAVISLFSRSLEFTTTLIEQNFTDYDLRRLESYTRNLVEYHLILDLVPTLARLFYLNRLPIQLTVVQLALLAAIGLQYKTIEQLETELNLPQSQLLALFNKSIKKIIDVQDRFSFSKRTNRKLSFLSS